MVLLVFLLLLHTGLSCLADFTSAVSVPEVLHFVHLINSRGNINCRCHYNGNCLEKDVCEKSANFERAVQKQREPICCDVNWHGTRNQLVANQRACKKHKICCILFLMVNLPDINHCR